MKVLVRVSILPVCLALLLALTWPQAAFSQVAGQNVNMVSGTQWPNGDPFLQRQNEPSMAVSTRNPLHIFAGANDYRSVDLETILSGGAETGDAWLGIYKSFDGGYTWQSNLLPGCPYAVSQCKDSGALQGQYQAGADPVVRAGTNGMFYFAGLAFDRATSPTTASSKSTIFVARYNDLNNNEQLDPITYIDTHIVALGNSAQFLDKPSMAVDIPRAGAATCSFTANEPGVGPNGGSLQVRQSFPAGNVYLAYTDFLQGTKSNATPTHLMFARSTDCGVTWSTPIQINTGTTTSQGSTIAVNPITGAVYVAWRQFASAGISDAILIAQSTNGGKSFSKPVQISTFQPFDQGTTGTSFRTNAYPALTSDMFGFVYVAFSARGVSSSGDARIVAAGSIDGTHWTPAIMVDNPSQNSQTNPSGRGHQLMPAMTFANGRLTLLYYDLRLDHYAGVYTPNPASLGSYTEMLQPEGELGPPSPAPNQVFTPYVDDAGLTVRRHTLDLRVLELGIFPTVVLGPSVLVSQYSYGCCVNPEAPDIEQYKFNVPNLPLFDQGQEPFLGDYIDIVPSPAFVPSGNSWRYNFMPSVNPLFHASWTDNRDVVPPPPGGSWENYTAPVVAGALSVENGQPLPACISGQEGMRNQNIYTAQITGGLVVGAPGNAKPLGTTTFNGQVVPFQRAFPVEAQNTTASTMFVRFTIASQPTGGAASFLQFSLLTTLDVTIPPYSSVSRSVFATSTNPLASISVTVSQINAIGGSVVTNGLSSTAVLNPDITNPNITNPNITNPNITNPNITNDEVTNPNITNPNITNPNITNPNITNPDITNNSYLNPNITNPNITNLNVDNTSATNPNITNPNITNPNITNPNITNPNITNPNITNPDITNGSIQDVTYPITNNGNTTASYTVKTATNAVVPGGIVLQLMINKLYQTPVAANCQLGVQTHWVTVANITNPKLFSPADPNITNPDITNASPDEASVTLAPGETAFITIRVVNPTPALTPFNPITAIVPVTVPQAVNTITVLSNPGNPNLTAPPVYPPVSILTAALPATDRNDAGYSVQLQSAGGKPGAVTWTIVSGALPPGINLSSSGLVSGTAGSPGSFTAVIQAADGAVPPNVATQSYTLNVSVTPLQVQTSSPAPDGVVGQNYIAFPVIATGGTAPIVYSVVGSLPPGLSINSSTGQIFGIPTTPNPGGTSFTVNATDAATPAETVSTSATIGIGAVIQVVPATLPAGTVGTPYSFQLTATGGIGGYAFGPPTPTAGVNLAADGTITIANPQSTSISFQVTVHDAAIPVFQTVIANYTIQFAAPAMNVTFVNQPPNYQGGLPNPNSPIIVHVADSSNAAVAGVNVTLSFNGTPPCASATLSGTLTQQTQASGNAFFTDVSVNRGQIGYTLTANVQGFTATSNPFTVNGFCPTGGLSVARAYPTSTLLQNGQVLIAGGQTSTAPSNAADIYDPATGQVTSSTTLVTARFRHTATALRDGTVLIVGGQSDNGGIPAMVSTAEIYTPGTGFANTTNSPNATRRDHTATLLADGTVLIAGGSSGGFDLTSAEIYNPANQTFTSVGSLNHARSQHTATLLTNGEVLIAGGSDNTAELYDPVARTFSLTGNLSAARGSASATLLTNGQVLIAGGLSNNNTGSISTAELYNPATGTFTLTNGGMQNAREDHTATLLPDGTVLVAGGFNCPSPSCQSDVLGSAEIYNPSFNSFITTGSLINFRWQDTAIALNDGTVLVAGGFGSDFLSSAERYFSAAPVGPMFFATNNPIASPTTTTYSNSTAFNGAASGISVINFNNISVPPAGFAAFNPLVVSGVGFSTPNAHTSVNVTGPTFYPSTPYTGNFIVDSANNPPNASNQLLITLPAPMYAVALDYGALGFHGASNGIITLSNGFVLPLSSLPTAGQTTFAGFVSNTPINWLTYTATNDDWVDLDVLLASPVSVTLPNAIQGKAYAFVLQEQGGVGTVAWTQSTGTLPPGITLSPSGILNGTSTVPGVYTFTVSFTDSSNPHKTASSGSLTITVLPQFTITTTSLPNGTDATPYTATISTSGGIPPISFSLTTASFPPGLTITQPPTGTTSDTLAGTLTLPGVYSFSESVADHSSPPLTATQNYTVTILPTPPTITQAGANTANQPQIFWSASNSSTVVAYRVYRSVNQAAGPFTLVGTIPASSPLTFTDPNTGSGNTYYYVVTTVASSSNVESVNSNVASVVLP
ncbi:MAG TPA: kelch repeat-containing protein [Candidatus Acidoferrum sp.]|nr:kelch repeat-containing protein [Candidatus Acidoferrum sp.]